MQLPSKSKPKSQKVCLYIKAFDWLKWLLYVRRVVLACAIAMTANIMSSELKKLGKLWEKDFHSF
ncbi:MAG: hypothetical protein RMY34_06385 [Aulosira sp. DedQUE10]|nr:hypothetical protein [Aulosira sp. DedQUE10]